MILISWSIEFLLPDNYSIYRYIRFLESQLESTNVAKKKCLEEVQRILKKEEQARSLLDVSRGELSALRGMEKMAFGGGDTSHVDLIKRESSSPPPKKAVEDVSGLLKDVKDSSNISLILKDVKDNELLMDEKEGLNPSTTNLLSFV